jgi:hypothetical protein
MIALRQDVVVAPAVVKLYRGVWLFSAMVNSGQNHRKGSMWAEYARAAGPATRALEISVGEFAELNSVSVFPGYQWASSSWAVTDYLPVIGPAC